MGVHHTEEAVTKWVEREQSQASLKDLVIGAARLYRRAVDNRDDALVETAGNYLDLKLSELDIRLKGALSERLEKVERGLTPKQHKVLVNTIEQAEFGVEAP